MLFFDIETIPDLSSDSYVNWKLASIADKRLTDEIKILRDKEFKKLALGLKAISGKIIFSGLLLTNPTELPELNIPLVSTDILGQHYGYIGLGGLDENKIVSTTLKIFAKIADETSDFCLVTYNGKLFDVPYLYQRAWLLGIEKPDYLPSYEELTAKYNSRYHKDLLNLLNPNSNYQNPASPLREWAYRFNATDDLNESGADIYPHFLAGNWEAIASKNKTDLAEMAIIMQKIGSWL